MASFTKKELEEGISCRICFDPSKGDPETELFHTEEEAVDHYRKFHGIVLFKVNKC